MDEISLERAIDQLTSIRGEINPDDVFVFFDRDSDVLSVQLFGKGISAVSIVAGQDFLIRWDRLQDRVVGYEIEHFLTRIAPAHPEILDILDIAELRGLSVTDIGLIRREIGLQTRSKLVDRAFIELALMTTAAD